jgi:hypothetical protein
MKTFKAVDGVVNILSTWRPEIRLGRHHPSESFRDERAAFEEDDPAIRGDRKSG